MPSIRVLDQSTINQIAAGEVIERPSSVVKELVENAMDAGATAITIEIKEGGISFLRITDNGCGMEAEDVPLAFLPHATSKIRTAEDLLRVSSLGFRGEALASIAAVAQVELITKTKESLTGIRYRIEGGEEKGKEEIGAPDGTTFVVRNLFFNTPARQKFLKTPATEGSYISSLAERLALSHPDISFRLIVNNQTKIHTAGNHKLKDMIYTIYGREVASSLLPLDYDRESVRIRGFAGTPEINRGNRTYENYFINGRYVKSSLINKAIENAYRGFVMQQKYPFVVFHMDIPSDLLDVNVHPTKMELRFREEDEVYQAVYGCIRSALTGEELIPRHAFEEKEAPPPQETRRGPEPFEVRRQAQSVLRERPAYGSGTTERVRERPAYEPSTIERLQQAQRNASLGNAQFHLRQEEPEEPSGKGKLPEEPAGQDKPVRQEERPRRKEEPTPAPPRQMELFEDRLLTPETRSQYRIIGQLFDTYWMFQYKDQLLIMDQHAAHEKVFYEKNVRAFRDKEFTSQQMQPPVILTLNAREVLAITRNEEIFNRYGFQIEPFGGREYAVYAVPGNLLGLAHSDVLLELIDSLADEDAHTESSVIEDKLALMSCKAAVKGNNRLSVEEVNALLDELLKLENPFMCPHGRPTIITMSQYELEKKFKRVVS